MTSGQPKRTAAGRSQKVAAIRAAAQDPLLIAQLNGQAAIDESRRHDRTVKRVRKVTDAALRTHGDNRDAVITEITQALAKEMGAIDHAAAASVLAELLPSYLAQATEDRL